jgi:hypothetical protein
LVIVALLYIVCNCDTITNPHKGFVIVITYHNNNNNNNNQQLNHKTKSINQKNMQFLDDTCLGMK